ncbi:hypothetical protein [Brevundimonas sp. UBA7664]|uniref:hypothetical protein n=1 Tax=Brevundimonas sp. UBA7664 TaxID=1946141 RepID=UPI0025C6FF8F|nr:hypothetical protein [Brevundimonas sp. UBA7664]
MSATATRNSPALTISTAQLALAILVQVVAAAVLFGGQFQRVDALERVTEPLAKGDLVAVQRDVAWIRERLEKGDRP